MTNNLIVAPAPHVQAVSVWVFGAKVLCVTALAVTSCVAFEYLIQRFLVRGPLTVNNLSAAVTGVLLAFNLPVTIPWWIVVIGALVAVGVAKMSFGGLGKNPFNPALVGRVFLLIAYPVQMTTFPVPARPSRAPRPSRRSNTPPSSPVRRSPILRWAGSPGRWARWRRWRCSRASPTLWCVAWPRGTCRP